MCLAMVQDDHYPHLVLLGNSGIGKAYFGYVLLAHLAHLNATVVYERGARKRRYLFYKNTVAIGSRDDFWPVLGSRDTYYIVDDMKPMFASAKTILLTSPLRSIWYQFFKTQCRSRHMPVWTEDELMQCRQLLYPSVPLPLAEDCFRRWGGIARYVLPYANSQSQQRLLEDAIGCVSLNSIWTSRVGEEISDVMQQVFHFCVTSEYTIKRVVFASAYVEEQVRDDVHQRELRVGHHHGRCARGQDRRWLLAWPGRAQPGGLLALQPPASGG